MSLSIEFTSYVVCVYQPDVLTSFRCSVRTDRPVCKVYQFLINHSNVFGMQKEEDSKSLMDRDRRKEAIKVKLQRLNNSMIKTKKDREGEVNTHNWIVQ